MQRTLRIQQTVAGHKPTLAGLMAAVALLVGSLAPAAPVAFADEGSSNPLELGNRASDVLASNPLLRLFAPAPLLGDDDSGASSRQEAADQGSGPSRSSEVTTRDDGESTSSSHLPLGAQFKVGIQAGHWETQDQPDELASLRKSTGAEGKGWREVDVNLDIAQRVVALLAKQNVQADLLPATVPVDYKADAFVALHGDSNGPSLSGYKVARATWSTIPGKDDALLRTISSQYAIGTGLREHKATITQNMTMYYAFNWRRLQHAVNPSTPSVILEMGFLTNASDRQLLTQQQDRVAQAIASGVMQFLASR